MTKAAPQARKRAGRTAESDAEAFLQAALALAEDVGWDSVTLSAVAARCGQPTSALLAHYRDKDALADAWFKTALAAMLAPLPADFAEQPPPDRLHLLLMRWLDALAPHRRVTGQMLSEKLYPSHPHHWVPLIFNLSRTVQWWRDAALLTASGRRRQAEEIGLTLLFLATLRDWLRDESEVQERMREKLERRLERADQGMSRWPGRSRDKPAADAERSSSSRG